MNKAAKCAASALLALILAVSLAAPAFADDAIHISTADELMSLAASCVSDTWSQGKTVELDGDISLDGVDFTPIPYFNGTFNGNGHTVSGLDLNGRYSRAGLFGVIGESGKVKSLNVSGTLDISGTTEGVGGVVGVNNGRVTSCSFAGTVNGSMSTGAIAGRNTVTGSIQGCVSAGSVFGSKMTGGIAGYNLGLIGSCRNSAYINTESRDKTLSIQDISIDTTLDLAKLSARDTLDSASDTGGVAGYSSGIVRGCVNEAIVGYQHVGYNVGGVAGRSCGFIASCTNKGEIYGRKDVGGIVGQMEPYRELNIENSALAKMRQQLNELNALIDQTASDVQSIGGTVSARLNEMSGYVGNAIGEVGNININIGSGGAGGDTGGDIGGDTGGLPDIGFDPDTGGIKLPDLGGGDIVVTPDLGGLTAAISAIGGQITMLNGAIAGASGVVANDIRAVNAKFNELSNTMFDAIFSAGMSNGDILTDTSEIDIELVRLGKVCSSTNHGAVSGDINIGGVVGAMAIEYELDPEDDLSNNVSPEYKREYELKAVLQGCTNRGGVSALRNYAGSVAGRMELGIITSCCGFGDAASENGDYVGGVVGMTSSTVRSNWAKCTLSGGKYVGGIVGSGAESAVTSTSTTVSASTVAGNVSMVEISDAAQYYGAISGADAGELLENYFVSDTLSGIDGVSYAGRSDRISYDTLLSLPGCPDDMRRLTLSFEVDDEVIKEEKFDYGASFGADVYPDIPAKDGYSGRWDVTELENLHFDTRVTAVYDRERTAIAADAGRGDGRSVIYVEGRYAPTDAAQDIADTAAPDGLTALDTSLDMALGSSAARLPWYARLTAPISGGVIEQRHISIPDDGQTTHTVHYLPPEITVGSVAVYVMQNGRWIRTDTKTFGSYVTFDAEGSELDIAAVAEVSPAGVIAAFAGILAFIALIIILSIMLRRRRGAKGAGMSKDKNAAEEKPAEGAAADGAAGGAEKPKKRRGRAVVTLIVCLALLAGVAAAGVVLLPRVGSVLSPYRALSALGASSQLEMNITVDAALGGSELHTVIPVSTKTFDGVRVSRAQLGSAPLYFAKDMLILENGKAYALGSAVPDYGALLANIAAVYKDVDVSADEQGNYSLTVGAEQADELLRILCPGLGGGSVSVGSAVLTLKLTDGSVERIGLTASGTLAGGKPFTVDAVIGGFSYSSSLTLPEAVSAAISRNDAGSLDALTDDVMNIISAWSELAARESVTGRLALRADCGPVVLNTEFDVSSTVTDGVRSYRIGANDVGVGLDGGGDTGEQTAARYVELADAAYLACISGDVTSRSTAGGTVYAMALDGDSISRIVSIVAPEAKKLGAVFSSGTAELTVKDGEISRIAVNCMGTMKVVLVETGVTVNAELTLDSAK